jgi:hypothetical protein
MAGGSRLAAVGLGGLLVLAAVGASMTGTGCSTAAPLAAAGGSCLASTDCAEGLICIPAKNAAGHCSSDVGAIQYTEEAGAMDAAAAEAGDATAAASDAKAPPAGDASMMADSGGSSDATPPPADASPPPVDATSAADAATQDIDATASDATTD